MMENEKNWECPAIGHEFQFICEHALTHFCPFMSIAVACEAIEKHFPDCEVIKGNELALAMRQVGKNHEAVYIGRKCEGKDD